MKRTDPATLLSPSVRGNALFGDTPILRADLNLRERVRGCLGSVPPIEDITQPVGSDLSLLGQPLAYCSSLRFRWAASPRQGDVELPVLTLPAASAREPICFDCSLEEAPKELIGTI